MINMGININDKTQDFTKQILSGKKIIETRKNPSLRPYIGQRVGIIRTGKGKATLVGYIDIIAEIEYKTSKEFRADQDKHLITIDSKFNKNKGFGYLLANPTEIKPIPITTKGIISRKIVEVIK